MKKLSVAIFVVATCLCSFSDVVTNGCFRYQYHLKGNGVVIDSVGLIETIPLNTTLTIPETIVNLPVRYIDEGAIAGWWDYTVYDPATGEWLGYDDDARDQDSQFERYWFNVTRVVFPSFFEEVMMDCECEQSECTHRGSLFDWSFFYFEDAEDDYQIYARADNLTLEFTSVVPLHFEGSSWGEIDENSFAKLIYPTDDAQLRATWENAFKKECEAIFYTDHNGTIWRDLIVLASSWAPKSMKYISALSTSLTEQGCSNSNAKNAADALLTLIGLNENKTFRDMLSTLGIQISEDEIKTDSKFSGRWNYTRYQPNDVVDLTMEEYNTLVSAINLLGKINPSWKGSIVISTDVLPMLTEDVYFDYADSLVLKASLESFCAASQIAKSYDLKLDYSKDMNYETNDDFYQYGSLNCEEEVRASKSLAEFFAEQPEFAGRRKANADGLAKAKEMAKNACVTAVQAVNALEARDDIDVLHLFNLEVSADLSLARRLINKAQTSIESPVRFEESGFTERVTFAPFFNGTGPVYDNLPEIVDGEFVEGSEPDPSFCGILPDRGGLPIPPGGGSGTGEIGPTTPEAPGGVSLPSDTAPTLSKVKYTFETYKGFGVENEYEIFNLQGGKVSLKKIGKSKLPSGVRLKYDKKTGKVVLSGSPSKAGTFEYTFRVDEKVGRETREGFETTFKFVVKDMKQVSQSDPDYNPAAGKKVKTDIPIFAKDGTLAGLLNVSISTKNAISAKIKGVSKKSLSFKGKWQKVVDGELCAIMAIKLGEELELVLKKDGNLCAYLSNITGAYGAELVSTEQGVAAVATDADFAKYVTDKGGKVVEVDTSNGPVQVELKITKKGKVTYKSPTDKSIKGSAQVLLNAYKDGAAQVCLIKTTGKTSYAYVIDLDYHG